MPSARFPRGLADSFNVARKVTVGALLLGAGRRLFVEAESGRPTTSLTRIAFARHIAFARGRLFASDKFSPAEALARVLCTREWHPKLRATIYAVASGDLLAPPL